MKPLTNELKYFISNLDKKIEIANGDSAVDVMKVLDLATKSLIGELKNVNMQKKKYFCS